MAEIVLQLDRSGFDYRYVQLLVTHLTTKQLGCDDCETVSPVPLIKVALGEAAGRRAAGEGNPVSPGQPPDKL